MLNPKPSTTHSGSLDRQRVRALWLGFDKGLRGFGVSIAARKPSRHLCLLSKHQSLESDVLLTMSEYTEALASKTTYEPLPPNFLRALYHSTRHLNKVPGSCRLIHRLFPEPAGQNKQGFYNPICVEGIGI